MNHMCLEIDDVVALIKELEAVGIPLLLPYKVAVDGNPQAWIEDPDGNRIELMQMAPDSMQLKAIAKIRGEAVPA
jgi:lactoylglutathione lyase